MITGILGFAILMTCATAFVVGLYCMVCAREIRRPKRLSTGWSIALGRPGDPDGIDPDSTQWTLEPGDGTQLPVWEARTDRNHPGPCAATIVFLHGWGNSRTHSIERAQAILEVMQQAGPVPPLRLVFVDLRGHGDSSDGPSTVGMHELDDLGCLLDTLPADEPVLLLGHSLGAVLGIRAAARWPQRISGVLALAPYRQVLTPIRRTFAMRGLPGSRLTGLIARLSTSASFMRLDTAELAADMPQPLEVLTGSDDRICPPADGQRIAEAAPHGRFQSLDAVRHGDAHQATPQALAEAMGRLLAAVAPERAGASS